MNIYYVALGSNLGDRLGYLQAGLDGMRAAGIMPVAVSAVYETAPWGVTDQADFLNAVARCSAALAPTEVMAALLAIESDAGRTRERHWGPRTLDLDLIYSDGVSCESAYLTLPHRYFWERAFVLAPLRDVAPGFVFHGQTVEARLAELGTADVRRTALVLR